MFAQSFEQYKRNTLSKASPMLDCMGNSVVQIIARNLLRAYEFHGFDSHRALGRKAGVAANTVANLMHPDQREPGKRGRTAPNMDGLERLANAMGYEAWQFMLETFDPADRPARVLRKSEADWYARVEALYRDLPPDPLNGKD
jgi:transcriptional regulator with XRE-family HTH domain